MSAFSQQALHVLRQRLNGKPFSVDADEWDRLSALLLQAAESSPEPDGRWQPIATAPMDGSRFIAYREGRHLFIAHAVEHGQMPFVDQMGLFRDPTHWMPLPAKPSPETKEEQHGR